MVRRGTQSLNHCEYLTQTIALTRAFARNASDANLLTRQLTLPMHDSTWGPDNEGAVRNHILIYRANII